MTRLFGYFLPTVAADALTARLSYAKRQLATPASSEHSHSTVAEDTCFCAAKAVGWTGGLMIAVSGRPTWRGEVLNPSNEARILEQMGRAYRDVQDDLLSELEGPFALALIDPTARSALLAVDRMGIERMTYATPAEGLVFGTSARALAGFPGMQCRLREQALYDFMFMHMVPAPETVYEHVFKLPCATVLLFRGGVCHLRRYWRPRYNYASLRDFASLKESLEARLANAVATSGLDEPTGAFLSGGLDSSSVTGMLARQSQTPAKTFTVGFGETGYDELEYARIASRHFGCEAFEYQVTPADIVAALPRIATTYDEPFGNSSAVPTYFCARLAADHGVTHLLAGDGGDEIFGGNERYARQKILGLYGRLPQVLRRHLLSPLATWIDPDNRFVPLRKLKSYVDQASVPLPDRFETWNFMYREGRSRVLDAEFAEQVDQDGPLRRMRDVWTDAPSPDLLERMLWYDWHFTLADNDLRKVGTMCELAGIRVSYPMLHPDVVNLATCVPPQMKMKGFELRTFFRRAMRDFLPEEVLKKTKHGFGLPFGLWLKTDARLSEFVYSLLSDLKSRHIVSAEFLDELITQHRAGHASYYGYAIWDLTVLEAWLARHSVTAESHGNKQIAPPIRNGSQPGR